MPRNNKSRGRELDFASFVDALLWISIVKFPQQDISLAFWRQPNGDVLLDGAKTESVDSLKAVMRLIERGNRKRRVGSKIYISFAEEDGFSIDVSDWKAQCITKTFPCIAERATTAG